MPGSSPPTPSRVARRLLPLLAGLGLGAIVALALFGLRPVVAWTHHRRVPDVAGATVAPGPDGVPVVTSLRADSPAARAGLHVGDPGRFASGSRPTHSLSTGSRSMTDVQTARGDAMAQRILVVEDDTATADYIVKGLSEEGYVVDRADNGRDGLFHATGGDYAAIVLDRMLPGMDGLAVLGAIRAAAITTPVLVLSARGAVEDRVGGLVAGADDYLTKPFAFAELLARLRVLIRRGTSAPAVETKLSCANLEMDLLARRVKRDDRTIELQPREFRLLEYLLRHKEQVVTRTMLLEGVWDYHFDPGTNVIDVHVSRLRKKIDEGHVPILLHTVRGAGYRLGLPG